ncbi:MAG: aldose epimerase family protein [Croceibacterium sp.]
MKTANRNAGWLLVAGLMATTAMPALAADAKRERLGTLQDGTEIQAVTLTNGRGMTAQVMTLGAVLRTLEVPDSEGKSEDIVLGYDTPAEYLANPQYFGATVGRFANRIAKGQFTLDGKNYSLATNNDPNHLHGGPLGFDKRVWAISSVKSGPEASVTLTYRSPAGEEGYPGNLDVTAIYTLNERNELTIEYRANTDAPTIANITNHSFFNLSGVLAPTSATDHVLTFSADRYTPVDPTLIPTGELRPVAGTPFDFRRPTEIESRIRDGRDEQLRIGQGYDHNFVVNGEAGKMRSALHLYDPGSGRTMELLTDQPGVQFYSGNFLDGTAIGKGGVIYRQGDGLCFEPQVFPDAPNKPDFPTARLNPGQTYHNKMVLRFTAEPR